MSTTAAEEWWFILTASYPTDKVSQLLSNAKKVEAANEKRTQSQSSCLVQN